MEKNIDQQENILLRLRRIEGQVRGIQRMIEEEADCSNILNQIAAVKSATAQVGLLIFKNHARDCIWGALNQKSNDEIMHELTTMMSRLIK